MKIEANNSININGFSLACELTCKLNDVLQAFPAGRMEGYEDDEKGYQGTEIGFVTDDGEGFYVYARWGIARLGCLEGWHNPRKAKFKDFIEAMVANKKSLEILSGI